MILILMLHIQLSVLLDLEAVFFLLVLQVLYFLHVHLDMGLMLTLQLFHLSVKVLNLTGNLSDLILRVGVEIMDHVFFDLDDVSLDFSIFESFS